MKLTENVSVNYDVNVNVKTSNLNRSVEKSSRSWGRMRDAMLSTLFTGMQLDRIFGKVVDRNLEMMGGTDMLSSAFDIILLPKVSKLNEKFLTFASNLLSSSDATKDFVGNLFVGGWAFGKILSPLTNIVLLMGSFKYLLKSTKFTEYISGVLGLVGAFGKWLIILLIIAGTIYGIIKLVEKLNEKWESEANKNMMIPTSLGFEVPDILKAPKVFSDALRDVFGNNNINNQNINTTNNQTEIYNAPRSVTLYTGEKGFLSTPYSYDNW